MIAKTDARPPPDLRVLLGMSRRFTAHFTGRVVQERCTQIAASLAYTSLFALVPLFTVTFAMLKSFPAFRDWQGAIERFVFDNFVPALGHQVQGYLAEFSAKASALQAAGVAILVYTVLSMMSTIESTFNRIWSVQRRRPLAVRFVVYWAVLTLGPPLIGAGIVATSYVVSLPLLRHALPLGALGEQLLNLFPFIATLCAFVLFYKVIPNRPVAIRHAVVGGLGAALLFEIAKRLFAIYVTRFASQEAVYGVFATVPVFLLWIYLSWLIVLLGAVLAQSLETFDPNAGEWRDPWSRTRFHCAFRILGRLYEAQRRGDSVAEQTLAATESELDHQTLSETLALLDEANWIGRDERLRWVLVRALNELTLAELLRLAPTAVLPPPNAALDAADARLAELLHEHAAWEDRALGVSLAELFDMKRGSVAT